MQINYRKILVTASTLKFEPGVILGLDTKLQTRFQDRIERVRGESEKNANGMARREWKLTGPVILKRGDVVWADDKSLPKNGDNIFEEIWMPKTYQELCAPVMPKPERAVAKIKTSESPRDNMR